MYSQIQYPVEANSRLAVGFHEAGHAALIYWSIDCNNAGSIEINDDGSGKTNQTGHSWSKATERFLMGAIAGPLAECICVNAAFHEPIRYPGLILTPCPDATHIEDTVRALCKGRYSLRYSHAVQERTRAILEEPAMWAAIEALAQRLNEEGSVGIEGWEAVFREHEAPTFVSGKPELAVPIKSPEAQMAATMKRIRASS